MIYLQSFKKHPWDTSLPYRNEPDTEVTSQEGRQEGYQLLGCEFHGDVNEGLEGAFLSWEIQRLHMRKFELGLESLKWEVRTAGKRSLWEGGSWQSGEALSSWWEESTWRTHVP